MLNFVKLQHDKNWHNYLKSYNRFNECIQSHEVCKCEDGCRKYIMVSSKLWDRCMELLEIYKRGAIMSEKSFLENNQIKNKAAFKEFQKIKPDPNFIIRNPFNGEQWIYDDEITKMFEDMRVNILNK